MSQREIRTVLPAHLAGGPHGLGKSLKFAEKVGKEMFSGEVHNNIHR